MTNNIKYTESLSITDRYKLSILLFFIITVGGIFFPLLTAIICAIISPMMSAISRSFLYYFFACVMILFFATQKPFNDLAEYLSIYHEIVNGSVNIFNYTRFGDGFEFLFLVYMKFVGFTTSGNEQAFLLISYTIIVILLMKLINDVDPKFKLLFIALFFINLGFIEVTSYFLRQVISILIFLYGIKNKGFLKWVLIVTSVFVHVSSIINVLLYIAYCFINNKKLSKTSIAILGVVISIAALIFISYSAYLAQLQIKLSNIANNDNFKTLPLNYIILTTLNCLFIFMARRVSNTRKSFSSWLLTKEIILFFLLLPLPALSNRLGIIIFAFYPYFLYDFMKSSFVPSKEKYKLCLISLLLNLIAFLYLMYNVSNGNNLYSFLGGHPLTSNLFGLIDYIINAMSNGLIYLNQGN